MAKEKDEVTQEVTNQPPATARPGFSTQVTDAPDHPAAANPSQRVQEEQAAGRAAVRDVSGTPAAAGGTIAANPADADPARAAEVAIAMNAGRMRKKISNRLPRRSSKKEGELTPATCRREASRRSRSPAKKLLRERQTAGPLTRD